MRGSVTFQTEARATPAGLFLKAAWIPMLEAFWMRLRRRDGGC